MGDRRLSSKKTIIEISDSDSDSDTPKVGAARKHAQRFISLGNHEAESHQEVQEATLTKEEFNEWVKYTTALTGYRRGHQPEAHATAKAEHPKGYEVAETLQAEIDNLSHDQIDQLKKAFYNARTDCNKRKEEFSDIKQVREKHPLGYCLDLLRNKKDQPTPLTKSDDDMPPRTDMRSIPGIDVKAYNRRREAWYNE